MMQQSSLYCTVGVMAMRGEGGRERKGTGAEGGSTGLLGKHAVIQERSRKGLEKEEKV